MATGTDGAGVLGIETRLTGAVGELGAVLNSERGARAKCVGTLASSTGGIVGGTGAAITGAVGVGAVGAVGAGDAATGAVAFAWCHLRHFAHHSNIFPQVAQIRVSTAGRVRAGDAPCSAKLACSGKSRRLRNVIRAAVRISVLREENATAVPFFGGGKS